METGIQTLLRHELQGVVLGMLISKIEPRS